MRHQISGDEQKARIRRLAIDASACWLEEHGVSIVALHLRGRLAHAALRTRRIGIVALELRNGCTASPALRIRRLRLKGASGRSQRGGSETGQLRRLAGERREARVERIQTLQHVVTAVKERREEKRNKSRTAASEAVQASREKSASALATAVDSCSYTHSHSPLQADEQQSGQLRHLTLSKKNDRKRNKRRGNEYEKQVEPAVRLAQLRCSASLVSRGCASRPV